MAVKVNKKPQNPEPKEEETPPELVDFGTDPTFQILEGKKMPDFPSKYIEANKDHLFWEWIEKLEQEDWNHLMMYLYRELPVIDRQRVNPTNSKNIDVIGKKFHKNDHDFLTRHGSGNYKILVNDLNKAVAGRGGTLGHCRFTVNNPDYPPIFILDELVPEHPSNRSITERLMAEGKITREGKLMNQGGSTDNAALIALLTRMIEKQSNQPQQAPRDATAESVTQMFVKANDTVLGMVKDQARSDDPEKLIKMLAALKEMLPKVEASNGNEMLALILKMNADMAKVQSESQAARETMMMKMMEMMNNKPSSEDAEDKILGRIATYKELFGGDGGGSDRKKSIPELAFEYGAPVVLKVLDTIQGFVNIKNYQAGLAKQAANGAQPPQQQQAGLPEPQQPQPRENVVEMPKSEKDQLVLLIKGPAGPLIIAALQRGEGGDNFGASIEGMLGKLTYDQIASVGKAGILEAMQGVPEFWNQVVPASMEKFVDEFIAYGQEEEEG